MGTTTRTPALIPETGGLLLAASLNYTVRPYLKHTHRDTPTLTQRETHTVLLSKLNFEGILGILSVFGIEMGILLIVLLLCSMNNGIPQLSPETMELPWAVSALIQK